MKSNRDFRTGDNFDKADTLKKGTKLPPMKKSGKERHTLYSELEEEDDDIAYHMPKKESVFDYFDEDEDL